jgi:ribosomal subunit interface protein
MRYEIHKHDVMLTPQLEKIIEQKVAKLDKRMQTYHPDAARLELQFKRGEKGGTEKGGAQIDCGLTLHAAEERLYAQKGAADLHEALDRAFDALFKELERYRARLNKSLQPNLPKAGES